MIKSVSVGVDFLQYTIEVDPRSFGGVERQEDWQRMENIMHYSLSDWFYMYDECHWQVGDNKLSPYSHSITLVHTPSGLRFANVYYSNKSVPTVLVQHTGQGCSLIPEIVEFLQFINPRVGRLDIAVDVECDTRPQFYYDAYDGNLSTSFQKSPTGETFYLGSMKSDKYMRIYRYNEPHQRSHLLRFEIQYKREFARAAAWNVVQSGLRVFALSALSEYPLPLDDILQGDEVGFFIARKSAGNTILWLDKQVRPAILKLVRSGEFDARAWIEDVLNER